MSNGWEIKKLREVCELVNGRAYSKPELLAAGKYRVLRVGNFFTNDHWYYSDMELEEKKYCDNGDLLYAWSASFGPRIWTGGKVIYHYHIWKVVHDCTQIDQMFLFYFFQWDMEKIKADQGTGTTMMHVSMGSMNERDIHLPPLPEQQRIVALLDEAFAGLATAKANAEMNLQNARAIFESHLQSVFSQRGEGWVDSTIGSEIRFIDYRGKTPIKTASGIRLITAKNVKMGYLQEAPMEFIAEDGYASWMTRGIPRKGDVLFTTEAPLANVAQLDTDEKVAFAQRVIIMQPDKARLDSTFLKYLLLSKPVQESIRIHGTGATVQGIKASLLRLIEISFPESLRQQESIIRRLDALVDETQHLTRLYERKLAALEELKKSLLHQAFNGEL
jgi:type I restriction enzyme S subunit